jgi:hypothetical protein
MGSTGAALHCNTLHCTALQGLHRHWWLGPCSHQGQNAGYAWLEEDGRCPYDGKVGGECRRGAGGLQVWREGGSDVMQEEMVVARAGETMARGERRQRVQAAWSTAWPGAAS